MSNLQTAIQLAVIAHEGQQDKLGEPYILHPLRVMLKMKNETERIIAVLHDTIEDGGVSLDLIQRLFGYDVAMALLHLTRQEHEHYESYIELIKENDLARRVKLADLADNLDPARLDKIPKKTRDRLREKYTKAVKELK